jgi:UDP-galactopyranose mutase
MKATIIGGGFAGCTIAHLLARDGWDVTIYEKNEYLGGGCRTFFYGGHPFTYGPRVYYGYNKAAFDWLNQFVPIRRFPFELKTYVEQHERFYTYPIHADDIDNLSQKSTAIPYELAARDAAKPPVDFEDYWIKRVGRTLYNLFVNQYSKKMWMIDDNRIFDIFKWSAKDKPIESGTREAYKGSYIGYPISYFGYNDYFDEMTRHVAHFHQSSWCAEDMRDFRGDVLINTGPIDEFFGFKHGELPYIGRDFSVFILPCRQAFPGDVRFCHYAGTEPHTRITEFKKITYYDSPDSLFVLETPSKNNKLYPYLTKANMAIVDKYMAMLPPQTYSIGRLGTYKYSTIEQTIVQAFQCYERITGNRAPEAEGMEFVGIGDTSLMKDRKEE